MADLATAADSLDHAISAAERLGLSVDAARATQVTIDERTGYPGDLYVLALAGGTGVGKSSLLNALAGSVVSPAGVTRPTTAVPVAWVPAGRRDEAGPLLRWLGGAQIEEQPGPGSPIAILDLPDLDSIEPTHAARVDAVLPRVDAVLWVSDPEKYHDAVLHDVYLRRWMQRLARQAIVVNKVDRLGPSDAERIRVDLADRLRAEGLPRVPVLMTSAHDDVLPLRAWLEAGVSAKEVVTGRMVAAAREAAADLARAAGVAGDQPPAMLVDARRQAAAVDASADEMLAVIDLPGLREQAIAATQLVAQPRGGGPVGVIRSLVARGSGEAERRADPEGYLRRWRERGSPTRAVGPIRDVIADVLPSVPPGVRPALAALADPTTLGARFAEATDRAVLGPSGSFRPPTSRAWPLIGLGQLVAMASVVAGVVWLVALLAAHGAVPTATVDLPFLGPMPIPAALIISGGVLWFLLGRLLHWHAGSLGARWADRMSESITANVTQVVREVVEVPLGERDAARATLWQAAREGTSVP